MQIPPPSTSLSPAGWSYGYYFSWCCTAKKIVSWFLSYIPIVNMFIRLTLLVRVMQAVGTLLRSSRFFQNVSPMRLSSLHKAHKIIQDAPETNPRGCKSPPIRLEDDLRVPKMFPGNLSEPLGRLRRVHMAPRALQAAPRSFQIPSSRKQETFKNPPGPSKRPEDPPRGFTKSPSFPTVISKALRGWGACSFGL